MKKINLKYLHIAIIVLGIIFISIPIFHINLWFDESYTVGIVNKSFADIWKIGSNDVHPILYYWLLHIINIIFGANIYIYRIFSMIPIAILSVLGYTHIKKDFGEKVGMLFSFLVTFLPISCVYSGEIRMYTWAMLIISVMAIYAYRIYKDESKGRTKNWILFGIFSLASCYTHYYGLATAGILNVILFTYLIIKSVKAHKKDKKNKIYSTDLKYFTITAIAQIILYLPWFISAVLIQLEGMSKGFWIPGPSLKTFVDIFVFQFTGDLDARFINQTVAIIFGLIITIYTIYSMIRASKSEEKQDNKAGILSIGLYFLVMLSILILAIVKPLLFARYFLNLTGLFIFFLAYFIAKGGRKLLTIAISIMIIVVSSFINFKECKMNYDASNTKPLEYVKQDLQENDLLLFSNESGSGFVISEQLRRNSKLLL